MSSVCQAACLPERMVLGLVLCIAKKYQLPVMDTEGFHLAYTDPMEHGSFILWNKRCILWVDRFYIAYAAHDKPVSYIYLTRHHLYEERNALANTKDRGRFRHRTAEFRQFFEDAYAFMIEYETEIWVSPEYIRNPAT